MTTNERYYSRISFVADVEVSSNGKQFSGEMLDLSLRGTLLNLESADEIEIGASCLITIHLPSSDTTIQVNGEVVHMFINEKDCFTGIRFQDLDVDSMTRLRTILDLNLGDHEQVEEEMKFWLSQ